jgi:TPR repeat protein
VLLAVAVAAPVSASDDIDTSNATFAEAIQAVKDRNFRHAIKLFRLQAEQNQHDAQYNLALLLEAGKGTPQNFSEALVWAWSAKLGGIEASGDLAEDLLDMLPEDAVDDVRKKVKQRLEDRIDAGNAPAVYQLAQYHLEIVEEPDFEMAYIWYSISTAIGLPGSLEARDDARGNVDDEKIAELQDKAGTIYESLNITSD